MRGPWARSRGQEQPQPQPNRERNDRNRDPPQGEQHELNRGLKHEPNERWGKQQLPEKAEKLKGENGNEKNGEQKDESGMTFLLWVLRGATVCSGA